MRNFGPPNEKLNELPEVTAQEVVTPEILAARRIEAERFAPLAVELDGVIIGFHPIDVEATVASGWKTYGARVPAEG